MKLNQAVIKRLKELMKERNFKQYDFFSIGGMPKATVSQVLNGKRGEGLALLTVYEMATVMGVIMKEFFDSPIFDEVVD